MNEALFIDFALNTMKSDTSPTAPSDADLKLINGLKKNGPLRNMTAEDVQTRAICIMGEEPTSKLSIHPEGILNGRKVNSLSRLANRLPGAPMMVGHRMDKAPWGRTFKAEVLDLPGFTGKVVKEGYFFFNDPDGIAIGNKIDSGIWAEGSISYWFKEAKCSICHKTMARGWCGAYPECEHTLGKKDEATGQICYWYPHNIKDVAETSYVFKGAYPKTKSMLNTSKDDLVMAYSADAIDGGTKLEEQLCKHGFDNIIESEEIDGEEENAETQSSTDTGSGISPQVHTEQPDDDHNESGNGSDAAGERRGEETEETSGVSDEAGTQPEGSVDTGDSAENTAATGAPDSSPDSSDSDNGSIEGDSGGENQTDNPDDDSQSSAETSEESDSPDQGTEVSADSQTTAGSESQSAEDSSEKSSDSQENDGEETSQTPDNSTDNSTESGDTGAGTEDLVRDDVDGRNNATQSQECDSHNENSENAGNTGDADGTTAQTEDNSDVTEVINTLSTPEGEEPTGDETGEAESDSFSNGLPDEIMSIIHDPELDRDEKETAIREELGDGNEQLPGALDALSALAVADPVNSYTGFCSDCGTTEALVDKAAIPCPDCEKAMAVRTNYVHRPFTLVGLLSPKKSGAVNNAYFKKEGFRDLPDALLYVEPQYDGVWIELHKRGGTVKLFSAAGDEHTVKFPGIVSEAEQLTADNFILAGEVVKFRGRQRCTHTHVAAWIQSSNDTYDDKAFRYKPYDMIVQNNKDISAQSFESRRKALDEQIKFGKQIQPTSFTAVIHKQGDGQIVKAITDRSTREGAMVKDASHTYQQTDAAKIFEWKSQFELDCRVREVEKKEGEGFAYTCEIGRGKDLQQIGKTFVTKVEAKVGQIIQVSVDSVRFNEDEKSYSWTASKVLALRLDKKVADPITTVKKIAVVKPAGRDTNVITLSEVIPKLKKADVAHEFYLAGGLVEHGMTTHVIDIISRYEVTDEFVAALTEAVGEMLSPYLAVVYNAEGPAGPNIPIYADMVDKGIKPTWEFAKKFVIQRHGWGKKEHWDVRFGAPQTERIWGYTCFTQPFVEAGSNKTRCQEKKYHDSKWMNVNNSSIPVGGDGNPSKNLKAHMIREDSGEYDFIRRKKGFLEMILHGETYSGRYIWRELDVKTPAKKMLEQAAIPGDETGVKTEKIWVMWKPKEQESSRPVKKIAFKLDKGCLLYWETNEIDTEIEESTNLACE